MRMCSEEGCELPAKGRGLCKGCWQFHNRRGTLPTEWEKTPKKEQPPKKAPHRPRSWADEDLAQAIRHLDEGASYREASRSTGVPRTTLSVKAPGRGWTSQEGGILGAAITGQFLTLQRQIGLLQNEV